MADFRDGRAVALLREVRRRRSVRGSCRDPPFEVGHPELKIGHLVGERRRGRGVGVVGLEGTLADEDPDVDAGTRRGLQVGVPHDLGSRRLEEPDDGDALPYRLDHLVGR